MHIRLSFAFCLVISSGFAAAADGQPVAVRWWGKGMVSVESFWDLQVVVDPYEKNLAEGQPEISADVVLLTHDQLTADNIREIQGHRFQGQDSTKQPKVVMCPTDTGNDRGGKESLYHSLGRAPNEAEPTWLFHGKATQAIPDRSPILIDGIPAWRDDAAGRDQRATSMLAIKTDGVCIVHCGDLGQSRFTETQIAQMGKVDVLIVSADNKTASALIAQVKPRYVLPVSYRTPQLEMPEETRENFVASLNNRYEVDRPLGNTFAVSSADSDDEISTRIVLPKTTPWTPDAELGDLLQKMERACVASQQVFAELSAKQLSWQPPNGSHTPRWNAEHMMGRQLGFFSQIYAAVDPEITTINLNPRQMPTDYKPAHPTWDGTEEARQMQRSAAFVRRFAYLLHDVDLDKRAPGSRWTLRGLLLQMDRHFASHTANVEKKFQLEGWPER